MSQNKEWLAASDAWMIYSRELAALKENVDQQVVVAGTGCLG